MENQLSSVCSENLAEVEVKQLRAEISALRAELSERLFTIESQRERFARLTAASEIGVWYCDLPFSDLIWDEKVKEHFWLPAGAHVTIDIFYERIHPLDRERTRAAIETSIQSHARYDIVYRTTDPANAAQIKWIRAIGWTDYDPSGKPIRFDGITLDVTAAKKAEAKFAIERSQLETIFQKSPAAMVLWSGPDFIFEKVNPRYQAIFPDRVLQGRPFLEACPEFKDQPFFELLTKVLETGEPFTGHEILARHSDYLGGPLVDHYYDFTYMRVSGEDGKPYGVYDHAIDVTDKVRARETIQNQNLWLEEVLNRLPIGLIMAEPDTANYRFVNQAAQVMLGQAPKNARVELGPDKLIARDLNEKILSQDETPSARAAHGEELTNEVIILDKGTDRIFVSCNSNIIPAMPGQKRTVLVPFLDVTNLKAKEIELERAVNELKHERDLRERFVATLSHDLRTPLTAAKMSVQLINRNAQTLPANRKLAQRIDDGIDRMDSMIRDLLDASRVRAGERLPLEIAACELNQVVTDTLDELRTIHGDRFCLHEDAKIEGYWSKGEIRRIIENLASNAIKYGAVHRPVSIFISRKGEYAQIAVHNEGSPIAPEDQENLFVAFKRIEASSPAGLKGWGLGLSLVKGLTEAHGGNVTVESSDASGTCFCVNLPLDSRKIAGTFI